MLAAINPSLEGFSPGMRCASTDEMHAIPRTINGGRSTEDGKRHGKAAPTVDGLWLKANRAGNAARLKQTFSDGNNITLLNLYVIASLTLGKLLRVDFEH